MRLTYILVGTFACALAAPAAFAQPGGPPPPPPGGGGGYYGAPASPDRAGLTLGFGLGLGGMESESGPIDCFDCDYSPLAGALDFHIGAMINPRMAILFEVWGQAQTIDAYYGDSLVQVMLMGAVQYWATPQLWLKGGLGASQLSISYGDGYEGEEPIESGLAIMGAAGYEVVSAPNFSVDLQLRLGVGSYDGIDDQISAITVGGGVNWY